MVQEFGEGAALERNQFSIRTTEMLETGERPVVEADDPAPQETVRGRLEAALAPLTGEAADPDNVIIERAEVVGPAIGSQLRRDAMRAVLYSLIFMVAYLWFRYNLVFGFAAVAALFHDSLIALGLLALWGGHIDMTVIAAMLTVVGYSVNDTVVVFDRIREDMRLYSGRGWSYGKILNTAINHTLSRTILTSGLTFLAVGMLFIFGGPVLHNFAFYLMVGVLVGTYSSIFVAGALAYTWQTWWKHRQTSVQPSKQKGGANKNRRGKDGGREKRATV